MDGDGAVLALTDLPPSPTHLDICSGKCILEPNYKFAESSALRVLIDLTSFGNRVASMKNSVSSINLIKIYNKTKSIFFNRPDCVFLFYFYKLNKPSETPNMVRDPFVLSCQ